MLCLRYGASVSCFVSDANYLQLVRLFCKYKYFFWDFVTFNAKYC